MDLTQAISSAAVPAIIFSILIWIIDKYEREPIPLMIAAFLWGAVPAAIVSLIAEIIFGVSAFLVLGPVPTDLLNAALGAPIIEEIAKGMALLILALFFSKEFDGVLDGIVYGALIGFGFAMTENILYLVGCSNPPTVTTPVPPIDCESLAFLRTLVFGLNHALYTALTGAALGYALTKRDLRRWLVPPLGLWLAMLTHMLHNAASVVADVSGLGILGLIFAIVPDWGSILLLGVVVHLAWQRERSWLETHLPEEVSLGVISAQEYQVLMSWRRRIGAQLSALLSGGVGRAMAVRKRQFTATELAFYKERLARGEKIEGARIAQLQGSA